MTLENLKKHHARLKWLSSGEFKERDFDFEINANENPNGERGEKGWSSMGEFSTARRNLIQQDAQRTLKILERKYPDFKEEKKPEEKPEEKPKEEKKETKSKEKK